MDRDFRPASKPSKSLSDKQSTKTTPVAEVFRTPEEVAASNDGPLKAAVGIDTPLEAATNIDSSSKKSSWRDKFKFKKFDKREWLISAAIILIGGGIVGFVLTHTGSKPVVRAAPEPVKQQVKPATMSSNLTGLPVTPEVNQRPVTGVMIENSLDARPQSGLADAGVVFEAIAEGGITRFLALFQDTNPADIGPIRSARPYYAQWAMGFDAGFAHVGGSPEALASIKAWGTRDLDQFYNAGSYHRTSNRAAPHNVYTAVDTLIQLEQSKGFGTSNYTGFARKAAASAKQSTAKSIDMKISGPLYNTHYDYDAASNSYKRSEGGAPHIDANGNRQISPNVVIAMVVPYSLAADGYHSQYEAIGGNKAYVFQDGKVTIGRWSKPDIKSQLTFSDDKGKPLKLNPGQTWLTAITDGNVTYAP